MPPTEWASVRDALKDCKGRECALVQLTYAASGDDMEQARRAQVAPDLVARECEAGKLGACEGLRGAYSGGASRLPQDSAKASSFGAKANQLLDRQGQTGDRDACRSLVHSLLYSSPTDVPRGRRLGDAACAAGGYQDCWALGELGMALTRAK